MKTITAKEQWENDQEKISNLTQAYLDACDKYYEQLHLKNRAYIVAACTIPVSIISLLISIFG